MVDRSYRGPNSASQGSQAGLVCHQGRRLVEGVATHACKRMVGAGVDVQLHVLAARKGLDDGLARGRRAKTVKLSDMQHQAALDISGFSQRSFYADAVVA